jgi:GT2 family glycosyltransferase
LDAFSDDFALSARENKDVEMLVGFALAVRRSVLEAIGGGFDTRFGLGMFD